MDGTGKIDNLRLDRCAFISRLLYRFMPNAKHREKERRDKNQHHGAGNDRQRLNEPKGKHKRGNQRT
jgi:hypothetical protein